MLNIWWGGSDVIGTNPCVLHIMGGRQVNVVHHPLRNQGGWQVSAVHHPSPSGWDGSHRVGYHGGMVGKCRSPSFPIVIGTDPRMLGIVGEW